MNKNFSAPAMIKKGLMAALFAASSLSAISAQAAVVTYTDRASWEAAAGAFVETATFPAIVQFSDVSSLTLNGGTVIGTSSAVNKRTVGNGWGTWSGGYTGDVFYTNGQTALDFTATANGGLGFEMEPNPFDIYEMILTLSDGSVISQMVTGNAGAAFFGWVGAGVDSFNVSSRVDFAFGRFVEAELAEVPEPISAALLGIGLLGISMTRRKSV